jgi:hypothetical protein
MTLEMALDANVKQKLMSALEFPGFRRDLPTSAGMGSFVLLRTDPAEMAVPSR